MQPKSERFEMRLDPTTLERLDTWRARQEDLPSRAEAVRRLVEVGVGRSDTSEAQLSDGERLLLIMVGDLMKQLKVNSDIEPTFIEKVITGGHYWALGWQYPGVFHGDKDSQGALREVLDVLEMWSYIESSYAKLSPSDQERIAQEVGPLGEHVRFHGFDGNTEGESIGIAAFMINDLDRFQEFKKRDLNAHLPSLATYRRMLTVFRPLHERQMGGELDTTNLIAVLKEQIHPSHRQQV